MLATALTANVSGDYAVSNGHGHSHHRRPGNVARYEAFDDDVKSFEPMDLDMATISLSSICADAQREIELSHHMAYFQANEAMRLLRLHQQQHGPLITVPPQSQSQPKSKSNQSVQPKKKLKKKPLLQRTMSSPAPWMSIEQEPDAESIITYVGGKMVRVPSIRSVSSHLFVDSVDERSRARKSGLKRARSTFEANTSARE